jgi:hypothetical protein
LAVGNASLKIVSGFPAQPGIPNPLAQHPYTLLRTSLADIVAGTGVSVPPGSSPYKALAQACGSHAPACQQMIDAIKSNSVSAVRASATYYVNQTDGTFKDQAIEAGVAYSPDGKPQAGMGVSIGDYNRDGLLDIVKTNFAGDTDSLYMNLGDGSFDDRTYQAGLGINTRLLGWGVSFIDIDNDGWLDILVANGHVYPEVDGTQVDASYAERKYLYRNLRNGQFEDVSLLGGSGITAEAKARGFAVGDFDNDGDLDAVVNCVNAVPQLLRCDSTLKRSWVKIRLVGTKSNRTGIGARIKVTAATGTAPPGNREHHPTNEDLFVGTPVGSGNRTLAQIEEVRSCNGYYSASDLRIHFGLGEAKKVDLVEIKWPSGAVDSLKDLDVNRLYVVEEGGKILKKMERVGTKK